MSFAENLVLQSPRVRLEPLNETHFSALLPIALDHPNLLQYSPQPFGSEADLRAYVDSAIEAREKKQRFPFAILDPITGNIIGSTSFGLYSEVDQRVEIGWTWMAPAYQGTGLNRECKFLLLRYAFESCQLERVELKTDERNQQSRRAIEKIGGVYEGTFRSHTLMRDGHRRNTVYYSILKSEWPGVKQSVFQSLVDEMSASGE
jgi:RimJ/RimL family protein N-acetyltransferase